VDVSAQEVGASRNTNNIIAYQFDRRFLKRSGDCQWLGLRPARWIWRCKDGFLWHNLMGGKIGAPANRALSQWMDDDGMENPLREIKDWEKYDRSAVTAEQKAVREKAMERFFLAHTRKELDRDGRKRGINASVANSPADVLENPQLKARDYWAELNDPKLGAAVPRYGKHFFLSSETENYIRRAAPLIGEHNSEIYEKELGLSEAELAGLKEAKTI
jgi:crotonobetainyl-CoA:carnitine CoA-transferase CaiB-like acyl-CoA transferase